MRARFLKENCFAQKGRVQSSMIPFSSSFVAVDAVVIAIVFFILRLHRLLSIFTFKMFIHVIAKSTTEDFFVGFALSHLYHTPKNSRIKQYAATALLAFCGLMVVGDHTLQITVDARLSGSLVYFFFSRIFIMTYNVNMLSLKGLFASIAAIVLLFSASRMSFVLQFVRRHAARLLSQKVMIVTLTCVLLDMILPMKQRQARNVLLTLLIDFGFSILKFFLIEADLDISTEWLDEVFRPLKTGASHAVTSPPNVVLILVESLRASAATHYNEQSYATTNLKARTEAGGYVIETLYATVPNTMKSLFSIICGAPPSPGAEWTEYDSILTDGCLPNVLKELGYYTAFYTSSTAIIQSKLGFDEMVTEEDVMAHYLSGEYLDVFANRYTRGTTDYRDKRDDRTFTPLTKIHPYGYEDFSLLSLIDSFLQKKADNKPLFMVIVTLTTHAPYKFPDSLRKALRDTNKKGMKVFTNKMKQFGKFNVEARKYLRTVKYTDNFIEETVQLFERAGMEDNTIFIVTGDHGEGFKEHEDSKMHSNALYEETLRIPLLIFGKFLGLTKEVRIMDGIWSSQDFKSTILNLVAPGWVKSVWDPSEAYSLHSLDMLGSVHRSLVYLMCIFECRGVRYKELKVIYHPDRGHSVQAFNLTHDPLEKFQIRLDGKKQAMFRKMLEAHSTFLNSFYSAGQQRSLRLRKDF